MRRRSKYTKGLFGARFFEVLPLLELRLDILTLRLGLASKIIEAQLLIKKKLIEVNGKCRHKSYVVYVGDILRRKIVKKKLTKIRRKYYNWRFWRWRKWRRSLKPLVSLFWSFKKNYTLNFLEINYKILSGIVIRKPIFGEILLSNLKRMLSIKILKKIYYVY
jgi:hypothetical protein